MPFIGKRLKELRLKKKLTQKELAESLELSKSAVIQYENNKREPNFVAMIKIERFFGVSSQYLSGLSDIKKPSLELFLNKPSQLSEIIMNEDEKVKQYSISIINHFNYFFESMLKNFDTNHKLDLLRELDTVIFIISQAFSSDYSKPKEIWKDGLLDKTKFYQLQEQYFRKTLFDLEVFLQNAFMLNSELMYEDYVKMFEQYSYNEEFKERVTNTHEEIEAEGINKYPRLK